MFKVLKFLLIFLFLISFSNFTIPVVYATNVPTKITAKLHDEYLDVAGKPVTTDDSWEFWNVGALGGDEYSKAKLTIATTTMTWDGGTGEIPTTHSTTWEGTFSGGPNGEFNVSSAGYSIQTKLNNGSTIVYGNGKSATVDNPDAFSNWNEKNDEELDNPEKNETKKDNASDIKLPTTENWDEKPTGGMLDTSFPKVNKVMGDVELSDPDNRPSIWQKTWRFITNSGNWRVWEPAAPGQQIKPDSSLKTTAGRAILEFADGTKFILDRESTITFNAAGGFTIENGTGYMEYRKYGQKIILETRRGKFAIIGTTVSWDVDGDHVQFKVIEGTVEADPDDGSDPFMLTAGQEVLADEFGMSGAMKFDAGSEQAYWQNLPIDNNPSGNSFPLWIWIVIGIIVLIGIGFLVMLGVVLIFKKNK